MIFAIAYLLIGLVCFVVLAIPIARAPLVDENGKVIEQIDRKPRWFWAKKWQAGEKEVDELIAAGEVQEYDTMDEFLASLRPDYKLRKFLKLLMNEKYIDRFIERNYALKLSADRLRDALEEFTNAWQDFSERKE